jgi:clan AA aspartic protease (TIGR02281 family)
MALRALADVHYLQRNYLAAIDTLYLAKSYAHDDTKITQIVTTQRAITNEYGNALQNQQDHLALLDLYQRLVSVEPEYSAHYVGLAQAYLALGNEADARRTLNIIAYDPEAGAKAHQLLNLMESQNTQASSNAEAITLSPLGTNLLTRALFNDRTYGWLLLDTGASLTVITPQLLQELSLNLHSPLRKAWFNTANGVVEAPIFMIDSISIGGQIVDHLEVAVMDLNNQHINGLLGMNFLQHFHFSIDQQNNVLYLSPRG